MQVSYALLNEKKLTEKLGEIKVIYYTKKESQDHGLLVFKVIGAASQKEAENLTDAKWGKTLMEGHTLEGPPTICPLFSELKRQECR